MSEEFGGSWGRSKVEVTGLWPEISALLQKGYPLSEIFRKLKGGGKLKASKTRFYEAVRDMKKSLSADSGTSRTQQPRPKVSSQKAVVAASTGSGTGKFKYDPTEKVDF